MDRIAIPVGLLLAAALLLVLLLWLFQRRLIYFPIGTAPPAESAHPGAEDASFTTADGLTLHGYFVPASAGEARAAVIVFNGNAGHRGYRIPLAQSLSRQGLAVLLFDYRGYGGNPGSPTESGLIEDARAVLQYALSRDDVDPDKIVYFGESLGAGVAVALAVEAPPAALVLRSPFSSMVRIGQTHYPFLPVGLMLKDRYESGKRIRRVTAPLLVIAGEADAVIPSQDSVRLFEAAREPKRLHLVPGADHNDYELNAGEAIIDVMLEFLDETLSTNDSR
ncbi:MAG: alpha/beta hydrolase [Chloroflexi bacterium]|nr:alpha/beta hydrolase [Chloroflexota bacterium]MCY3937554.1 alpha/beta hydrolase [Chloroflexota bacterium]